MDTISRFLCSSIAVVASAASVHAHHGRDFLLVEDYTLPAPLSGSLLGNFSWERGDSDDELTLESGFFLGLAPRLALQTSVDFLDEGGGWAYAEIVDPSLHVQLTAPDSSFPVRISLSTGYQFGVADTPDHHHDDEAGHDDHAEEENGHEHDEEAEADGHGHEHSGIHRHGEDLYHARLVLETDFTAELKGVFNLIAVVPDGGDIAWGYSAGLRYSFSHEVAVGVEATGDFANHGQHEVILGGYFSPLHTLVFKLGVGAGLTDESPDLTLRTGVVWRF